MRESQGSETKEGGKRFLWVAEQCAQSMHPICDAYNYLYNCDDLSIFLKVFIIVSNFI